MDELEEIVYIYVCVWKKKLKTCNMVLYGIKPSQLTCLPLYALRILLARIWCVRFCYPGWPYQVEVQVQKVKGQRQDVCIRPKNWGRGLLLEEEVRQRGYLQRESLLLNSIANNSNLFFKSSKTILNETC